VILHRWISALALVQNSSQPARRNASCITEEIIMAHAKWCSPQLRRDLVSSLYYRAKAEGMPMTQLANRLIDEALARLPAADSAAALRVAEEPTTKTPG
jgi:hypothetical protein